VEEKQGTATKQQREEYWGSFLKQGSSFSQEHDRIRQEDGAQQPAHQANTSKNE
jgi:hypothetical protein